MLSLTTTLLHALINIVPPSDWTLSLGIQNNSLHNVSGLTDSIFINGNLARMLLATSKLTGTSAHMYMCTLSDCYVNVGNETYKTAALEWCDTFVSLQQITQSPSGITTGYWGAGFDYIV